MITIIPFNASDGNQEFEITLSGVVFKLKFKVNSRLDRWVMDIYNSEDVELLMGVVMVLGVDFLKQYQDVRLPTGQLYLVNSENATVEATIETLGDNIKLYYETI